MENNEGESLDCGGIAQTAQFQKELETVTEAMGGQLNISGGSEEEQDDVEMTGASLERKLPKIVRKRVKALRKNQYQITMAEANFYEKMHELEKEALAHTQHLYDRRRDIINGNYEPTDEECQFKLSVDGDLSDEEDDSDDDEPEQKQPENGEKGPPIGVPLFWPVVFQSSDMLAAFTEVNDLNVLAKLKDIQVEITDEPMGFKLHFHFLPNEYFSNSVLTKTYIMKCKPDPKNPFSFEGTEIIKSIGCPIDWNEGKDLTTQVIKKQQKHKKTGSVRIIEKTIKTQSFFNFFSPPNTDAEVVDEEIQEALTADFEIGQFIRERVVPRAALYFTGEVDDTGDEEEFSEESSDEGEDGEEEESEVDADISEQGDNAVSV